MITFLEACFLGLTSIMTVYLVRHYIFTLLVLRQAKHPKAAASPPQPSYEPAVSILIPARNEEHVIGRLLQRTSELSYPKTKLQVIVIDDASSDKTGFIAEEYAQHYPYIQVIHRTIGEGGTGKTAAMNVGFKRSNGEVILCFDADYYPQLDIVEKLVQPLQDPAVGAVQGRVVVLNEPQNLVTRLVALERIGGYRVDQEARDKLGLITQFGEPSAAFGVVCWSSLAAGTKPSSQKTLI
jgi:cellulose synthase/poly-beta-1,6-N-acetylglucosamine synthase-like glycosyltransferase